MEYSDKVAPTISAVDLFCGAGGLTHGLERSGIKVVAGVDVDPECKFPFEANNSGVFLERDITELDPKELTSLLGNSDITLLAGCAPCQPYSAYSRPKRATNRENDWELVSAFAMLVKDIQPDLVTMENVPQLAGHDVFQEFLESLVGYSVGWSLVDSSSYGVPQSRRRLVLLASRLSSESPSLDYPMQPVVTVRDALTGLTPLRAGERDPDDPLHAVQALSDLNLRRIRASTPGGTWRDWDPALQAACHRRASGSTFPSVYGRMSWDDLSPTITTQCFGYGSGRFGHPDQDRAISLREAAMIQTFPRSYEFVAQGTPISFHKLGRLIGNAVPVKLGEAIGYSLMSHTRSALELADVDAS